mmetsp:Transcript_23489/g.30525  ORF Transcript_23489/g.30525 Transcript_23489/m.30525 type:complete len:261 (+) Transcript_23489:79-861(+)
MSENLYLGIFSEECWKVFVEGLNQLFLQLDVVGVLDRFSYYKPCALSVISKILGYVIIIGSFGFKVPQILKVMDSHSTAGLSLASMEMDVFVYIASLGYSLRQRLPISAYGEQAVVLLQNLILVAQAWIFDAPASFLRLLAFLFATILSSIAIYLQPSTTLPLLPMIAVAASVCSRVPQISTNYFQGHTGLLSPITVALNVFGALARVFTTLSEAYDPVMLFSYSISFILSATLMAQLIYHRKATRTVLLAKNDNNKKKF